MQLVAFACIFRFINNAPWPTAVGLALMIGLVWVVTQTLAVKLKVERERSGSSGC